MLVLIIQFYRKLVQQHCIILHEILSSWSQMGKPRLAKDKVKQTRNVLKGTEIRTLKDKSKKLQKERNWHDELEVPSSNCIILSKLKSNLSMKEIFQRYPVSVESARALLWWKKLQRNISQIIQQMHITLKTNVAAAPSNFRVWVAHAESVVSQMWWPNEVKERLWRVEVMKVIVVNST